MAGATYLPVLVKCPESEREGYVRGIPVKALPVRALDLFENDRREFERRCGPLSTDEIALLKDFLKVARGAQERREGYAARAYEVYPIEVVKPPKSTGNAETDLQNLIEAGAEPANVVLWRERTSGRLNAGIFCEDITVGIAVLILLRFVSAKIVETPNCVVCGQPIKRKRGDRRRTCSTRCRTRKFRLERKRENSR